MSKKKLFDYELFLTQLLILVYGGVVVFLLLFIVIDSGEATNQTLNYVWSYSLLFWVIPIMLVTSKIFGVVWVDKTISEKVEK